MFSFHICVHYRIRYNVLDYHSSLFVVLPYAHCTIIIVGLALREGVDENIWGARIVFHRVSTQLTAFLELRIQ